MPGIREIETRFALKTAEFPSEPEIVKGLLIALTGELGLLGIDVSYENIVLARQRYLRQLALIPSGSAQATASNESRAAFGNIVETMVQDNIRLGMTPDEAYENVRQVLLNFQQDIREARLNATARDSD